MSDGTSRGPPVGRPRDAVHTPDLDFSAVLVEAEVPASLVVVKAELASSFDSATTSDSNQDGPPRSKWFGSG
jgi:hypothetical protein